MHTKFCLAVLTMLSLGCGFPPAAKWKVRNSFYINLYYIFYWKKKKIISGIRHCSQLLSCFPGFTYFLEKSSFKSWITIFYRKFGFDKVRPFRFNLFNVSKKSWNALRLQTCVSRPQFILCIAIACSHTFEATIELREKIREKLL